MADHPTKKTVAGVDVAVDREGWPHWTRLSRGSVTWTFSHEEARDLHYALTRIVAFLDDMERR